MLSNASRWLTRVLAVLYLALGLALFLFPSRLAPAFAWKVSSFVAMTIGGWTLGNAWAAFVAAQRWRWARVYPALLYLWLFGGLELAVVLAFRDKLRLDHPIAWLYLLALAVNALAALWGAADWLRRRPTREATGGVTPILRGLLLAFVLFVGFLGVYGLVAQPGWPATNGGIFPEVLSPFSLRSFGAFYLSLALATAGLLATRNLQAVLNFAFAEYGLIVFITVAALWHLRLFDFTGRPGGAVYIGIYVVVGAVAGWLMARHGTGNAP